MTKQEIEKAIENGESVWCVYKDQSYIYEIKAVEIEKVLSNTFLWGKEYYSNIKDVFKTKAEAEHYLHHANVERVEKLPFLTWEEFRKEEYFNFYTPENHQISVVIINGFAKDGIISIYNENKSEFLFDYALTEANFYKAYDECVRLFKQE